MFINCANQTDQNDTSVSPYYNIDTTMRVNNGIIAEWVHAGYKTEDTFTFGEEALFAKGTVGSKGIQKAHIQAHEPNREGAALFEKFEQKIFHKLHFPKLWSDEGISQPHAAAKEKCFAVCKKLFKNDLLIPDSILATKEEGMFLSYDRITQDSDRTMIIEIYNTLETALIICDNIEKKIIYNEDITEMDFSRAVAIFKA